MNIEAKLLFVGLYFTVATMEPFIALFLQDKQFDTVHIGVVFSISRVFGIVTTPFLCTISDHFKCHRLVLFFAVVAATAMMTALMFIPDGDTLWTSLALGVYMSAFACMAVLNDTIVMEILTRQDDEKRKELEKQRCVAAVNTAVRIQEGEEDPLTASMGVSEDEPEGESTHGAGAEYPSQRVWGSISYGTVAFLAGIVIEQYGKHANGGAGTTRPYLLVPLLQCASFLLYGGIVFATYVREEMYRHRVRLQRRLHRTARSSAAQQRPTAAQREGDGAINNNDRGEEEDAATEEGEDEDNLPPPLHTLERLRGASIMSLGAIVITPPARSTHKSFAAQLCDLVRFTCDGRILGPVVGGMTILFLSDIVTMTFVFPYARTELQGTPTIFSVATGAQLISEVLVFFVCSWMVKKIGPMWMLIISGISYGAKMMAYSVMPKAWFLILIGLIHGLCFAVMWSATIAHVSKFAKEYGKQLLIADANKEGNVKGKGKENHEGKDGEENEGERSALLKKDGEGEDDDHKEGAHHSHHNLHTTATATVGSRNGSFHGRSRASSHADGLHDGGAGEGDSFVPKGLNVMFFWVGISAVSGGLLPIMMGNAAEGDASLQLMLFRGCAVACWIVAVAVRVYGFVGLIQ